MGIHKPFELPFAGIRRAHQMAVHWICWGSKTGSLSLCRIRVPFVGLEILPKLSSNATKYNHQPSPNPFPKPTKPPKSPKALNPELAKMRSGIHINSDTQARPPPTPSRLVDEDIPPKFLVGRRAVDESEAMLGIERLDSALGAGEADWGLRLRFQARGACRAVGWSMQRIRRPIKYGSKQSYYSCHIKAN